jgi:uncharacterized membrane protein
VTRSRAVVIGLILVLAAIAISAWAFPSLPDRVPTHWNLAGQVNGYSSRAFAVSFIPAIIILIWAFMLVLPAISPRGFAFGESVGGFYVAMLAVIALLVLMHFLLLHAALTQTALSSVWLFAGIGALFVVVGSVIGRVKKNFWFGVRTPWTLANDEVWLRTNRLAGRLFACGGIAIVLASFAGTAVVVTATIIVVAVAAGWSIVYSYLVYRRIEGFGSES